MKHKKKKQQIINNVRITTISSEGKAIASVTEMVVFVDNAVPGDLVDLQIIHKKKNYWRAIPIHYHKYSDLRTVPFCQHFQVCGGCQWQNLLYQHQLSYKEKQVLDNLQRIGKVVLPAHETILPAPQTKYYRNKLEFTFSTNRWLTVEEIASEKILDRRAVGFHVRKKFDRVVDIETCYLQKDINNSIRNQLRLFAKQENIAFYDIKRHQGVLRNLTIRTTTTEQLMVIVQFGEQATTCIEKTMAFLQQTFVQITSLQYVINTKKNDTFSDLQVHLWCGSAFIEEKIGDLFYRIGAKSFFQTNSSQTYALYKLIRSFANFQGNECVYDIYSGAGTIALFLARQVKKVVGIEYVAVAIQDAIVNARLNKIENVAFYAGDIKEVLNDSFIENEGKPDVIITDPPRMGMHPDVVSRLLTIAAPKIIYVSCNTATQARDIHWLSEKYELVRSRAVDMFPHTQHIENIVLLRLKTTG